MGRPKQLPYIIIEHPRLTLRFIIDTGAEFSVINDNLCGSQWKHDVNVSLRAMGRKFQVTKLCKFPIFREFKCENYFCEFLEYNFNDTFDGLIGNNILSDLNCIIDYKNRQMTANNAVIPIYLNREEEDYRRKCFTENIVEVLNNEISFGDTDLSDLEITYLNATDRHTLMSILKRHNKTFYREDENLSFTNKVKHAIHTQDDIPVYAKLYRYPEVHKREINRQIYEMLRQGIIRESSSPYNSTIWIVPKKLDATKIQKWRLVID